MMALLYAAAGMLAGALFFQLLARPGRQEWASLTDRMQAVQDQLASIAAQLRTPHQPAARAAAGGRGQLGNDAERLRAELERFAEPCRQRLEELYKVQATAVRKLEELQGELNALGARARAGQPGPPPPAAPPLAEPTPVWPVGAAAAPLPASPPEPVARLVSLWNQLPWPQQGGEALLRFRAELAGYQLAGPFKQRYWLLHGDASERLFLLPALGKDVSHFGDGFFELPVTGNTHRMRTPAEVSLREAAPLDEQLARLTSDSNITPNDIFSPVTRGHLE